MHIRHLALLSLFVAACAKPPAPQPPYVPKLAEPDWAKTTEESTALLQSLIQVQSVNPPPEGMNSQDMDVATKIAAVLTKEGIESIVVDSSAPPATQPVGMLDKLEAQVNPRIPGRGNVMARLKGDGSKKPIILLCHLDVVPVERESWSADPFAATIKDGYVIGRGAFDDKGMCTANLMAFISLKRQGVPLKRDVIFLATADEEANGTGVEFMIKNYSKELEAEYLINEGGIILEDAVTKGQTLIAISAAEKGVAWIHLTAKGKPGHGSIPRPNEATDRMRDALEAIKNMDSEKVMHPYAKELVLRLGETKGGFTGVMMRHPNIAPNLILNGLASSPTNKAVITNTINLTMFKAGDKINVVPGVAEAWLDCRLLPNTTPQVMQMKIEDAVKPFDVEVELTQGIKATGSGWDTDLFRALERHMSEGIANSVAAPILSPGYTDSRPFRERGVIAYGIVPFMMNDDEFSTMHGNNERLKISELGLGVRRLYRVLIDIAS